MDPNEAGVHAGRVRRRLEKRGAAAGENDSLRRAVLPHRLAGRSNAEKTPANLRGARLDGADLAGADLAGRDLRGASLVGANLQGANLSSALLCGANVAGADLSNADVSGADLASLRYDTLTRWPDGFDVAAATAPRPKATDPDDEAPGGDVRAYERKVFAAYFDEDDRLRQIPLRSDKKKIVVLRRLVRAFALNQRYSEREVSQTLARFHPDFATLRRMLVDYRFLARANGIYWRTWIEAADFAGENNAPMI